MPKPKTLEAQQALREKWAVICEQRRGICAELVKEVCPHTPEDAMPKKKVIDAAVAAYQERAEAACENDPFLSVHSDSFISVKTMGNYWSDIRQLLAQDGVTLAWNSSGIFQTTLADWIEQSYDLERSMIKGHSDRYNLRAELTNKRQHTQLPTMAVQLLLPVN